MPAQSGEHMNPSSQPFKVLAVDDSAIYRNRVEQSLSAERYPVVIRA
jgi:PleD family two-component response regulator